MEKGIYFNYIAKIETDFKAKFGIPRQSGLVSQTVGKIVFEPTFRNIQAVRGLQDFSHIWLFWEFSENREKTYSPTVRPPRLGGNERMGVFATRSPFRPNPLGLSVVKLEKMDLNCADAPVLYVSGVDMMNGTPIYDIKPYIPYTDAIPTASGGFTEKNEMQRLEVSISDNLKKKIATEKIEAVKEILSLDPRPSYQKDETRIYGFIFADMDIQFQVKDNILTIVNVIQI